MNDRYGPWTTALGPSGACPQLSHLWKARMARLGRHEGDPPLTRRDLIRLGIAGASAVALPTLRPTAVGQEVPPSRGSIFVAIDWKRPAGDEQALPGGIYAIDPETGTLARVRDTIRDIVNTVDFRLSPDGTRMAYHLYEKDTETSVRPRALRVEKLRDGKAPGSIEGAGSPVWSPDGKRLIWRRGFEKGTTRAETWVGDLDGENAARLPIDPTETIEDWSSEGDWLLAVSSRHVDQGYHIHITHPDGTGDRQLTDTGSNFSPRFSPDGRKIAFIASSGGKAHLDVMDRDGKNRQRAYEEVDNTFPESPCWSPDSRRVVAILKTWSVNDVGQRFLSGAPEDDGHPRLTIFSRAERWSHRILPLPPIHEASEPNWR